MSFAHRSLSFLKSKHARPEAPLFVFLPGMDGTGQLLRAQTAGLEAAFEVHCLVIPSDDLTSWADLTEQTVKLIRAEMQSQGDRPVYLCGESFGACLAMKVALHSPHLFERVILVNPASSFHRRPWIHWGSQITRLLPEPMYRISCVTLMPFLAALGKIAADDRQALLEAMLSVTQESSIWRLSLLQQFDVTESALKRITQPVLLIVGGGDRLLPSRTEAELLMGCLPQAQIYVLPTSGHACLLETDVSLYKIMQESHFLEPRRLSDKALVSAN